MLLLAAISCREAGMLPHKQTPSAYPVVVDEAQVAQVNLATALEDEEREIDLALRSVPPADKERTRALLRSATPIGAEDPEVALHMQRLLTIRTARIRHEMAQAAAERALPTMRMRLAIVDRLPMKGARAVVVRQAADDVDGTVLVPAAGATGADVDLAVRALQRSLKAPKSNAKKPARIAIRSASGANDQAAAYWSDVLDQVRRHPEMEIRGIGTARFTLVNVRLPATR
jgi:hypothetical protein